MKKSLFILLLLSFAANAQNPEPNQEPSEVKEIRTLYQKIKKESTSTQNKLELNYQRRLEDQGDERDRALQSKINAYFSDNKKDQLDLISFEYECAMCGREYAEYLFDGQLVFAYNTIAEEGRSYDLRCYFNKSEELIHVKADGDNDFFDNKNPQEQCKILQEKAKTLKNSLIATQKQL